METSYIHLFGKKKPIFCQHNLGVCDGHGVHGHLVS